MPLDPLDVPPMFVPPDLRPSPPPRIRSRRARAMTASGERPGREEQEAADESLALQLQEQQLEEDLQMMDHLRLRPPAEHDEEDPVLQTRQRAARRAARRRAHPRSIIAYEADAEEGDLKLAEPPFTGEDPDAPEAGSEAAIAGLRHLGEGRVESWRQHI
jgi:hypothetical protein